MNRSTSTSAADFIARNQELLDSKIMLTHYSASVLFSADARASFVEPDLDPDSTCRSTMPIIDKARLTRRSAVFDCAGYQRWISSILYPSGS